ncbi:AAA family ATPase [Phyllobacterium sp. 21LDTY02-6]|uniref:AAA family ATPase n=1 Tax=Phyllobacterium sp. 21LDTY02-6 TaxID=2944903 RepID=UPI00201FFA78|nr:AAA family ATPase [Phyllobacterium sp. 21LDTY02-6]MCO4316009.1 AAA family ATPase [Phyllobacterium sp. 21LDTY02-6]
MPQGCGSAFHKETSVQNHQRFTILTGGPGSGKTTLLGELAHKGHATSSEAGRAIIQYHQAIGGPALPWNDPLLFAELMLAWELRSHATAPESPQRIYFDRGVPDVIGYLGLVGIAVPAHVRRAAELYRYHRTVFILPPWKEIFGQDTERKQDFADAERTYEAMLRAYRDCGYDLVEVPRLPVEERADFILKQGA